MKIYPKRFQGRKHYAVHCLVSKSFDRVYLPGEPWRKHVITKRFIHLSMARRYAAAQRKDRVRYFTGLLVVVDGGPTFSRVWIEEVPGE